MFPDEFECQAVRTGENAVLVQESHKCKDSKFYTVGA